MTRILCRFTTGALVVMLALVGTTAFAEVEEDTFDLEFYIGSYDFSRDFDSTETYGIRLDWNVSERVGIFTQLGWFDADQDIDSNSSIKFQTFVWDWDVNVNFLEDRMMVPVVYGGIGWASSDYEIEGACPIGDGRCSVKGYNSSSFTANIGAALRIDLGERLFLKPDVKWRWYEQRESDSTDAEYTLSLGIKFGT